MFDLTTSLIEIFPYLQTFNLQSWVLIIFVLQILGTSDENQLIKIKIQYIG